MSCGFGWVLNQLKDGHRVRRESWPQEHLHLSLVEREGPSHTPEDPKLIRSFELTFSDGTTMAWTRHQDDLLADDWIFDPTEKKVAPRIDNSGAW